jgi:transposase
LTDIHHQARGAGKDVQDGDDGRQETPRRRSFTPEFKAEVLALVRQPGKTAGGVAREMGLTETAVRAWVRQAECDDGVRTDGLTTAERAELAQLRKELRETREERDILKRAVACVSRMRARKRCRRSNRPSNAAREMEVGPPQPPCRRRLQTTARCVGQEPGC